MKIAMNMKSLLARATQAAAASVLFASVSYAQVPKQTVLWIDNATTGTTILTSLGAGSIQFPALADGPWTVITTGNLTDITGTGTLTGGATGAGFTLDFSASTI